MKKHLFAATAVCIAAGTFLISSCNDQSAKTEKSSAPAFSLDSVKAAITANNKVYGECFTTGDSVKFAGCYTTDACINPPNMARICGTQAITGFFNGAIKMGIKNIKLTTEEVMGDENVVSEIGKYDLLGDKDVSLEKGKFIVVWKNENGKWKMHRDEWNSDNPPPPAAPADKK